MACCDPLPGKNLLYKMFNVFNLNNIHAYLNSLILINFQIGAVRSNCPLQASSQAARADIAEVDEKRGEQAPPIICRGHCL